MDFDDPEQLCLRGSLILADPSLRDPNFFRSVLLLTEHGFESGAHGYVLNRPLGKTVAEILPPKDFEGLESVEVFVGGPVNQEQLTFAALRWNAERSAIDFKTHLSTSQAAERTSGNEDVRAFVGYAGWAGGQLEMELQQRAWIACKGKASVVKPAMKNAKELWRELMLSMGPYYHLLADTPEDPTLN